MSVAVFNDAELEAMWGAIDPHDTDVARALYVLGCANRAAAMCSYKDPAEAPRIEAPRLDATPKWVASVGDWLQNLVYNCVSNGGSNFAPDQAVETCRAALARRTA
jgi:hypothetical protein